MKKYEKRWSVDGLNFKYETLGDLILDNKQNLEGREHVYVAEVYVPFASDFVSADDVLDGMLNRAHDECGRDAEDFPDATPAAIAELEEYLSAWADKHCPVRFYAIGAKHKYLLSKLDIEQALGEQK